MGTAPLFDGMLRFADEGSGPAVVLISGLGGLISFWAGFAEACAASFRVIRYDHRGVGGSSPLAGATSTAAMADDLLALLDHLSLERVAIVGHSTGGAIAQHVAARHPDRLSGLVLSATFARPCAYMKRLFASRLEILDRLGLDAYRRHAALLLHEPAWIAEHDEALEGDLLAAAARDRPGDASVVRRRIEAVLAHDGSSLLPRITCPTHIVVASNDAITPRSHSDALAAAIPGSTLSVLPHGGHYAVRAAPEAYRDAVLPRLHCYRG